MEDMSFSVAAEPPPPPPPPPPPFIPTTVIKKGPLKKAILYEHFHQQAQTTLTTLSSLSLSTTENAKSTTTEGKTERPTTPTRPINVGQPTTPDTGLKLKSRWYYRSEQETPSSTTTTSEIISTTVVAVVPPASALPSGNDAGVVAGVSNVAETIQHVLNIATPNTTPFFERIEDNIYFYEGKKSKKGKDSTRMICECSKEDAIQCGYGCGDECLNRILYYECGSNCPCGSRCTNRRFQKHQHAKVEPFPAGAKGHGLRALAFIPKHTFVIEYVGEVLSPAQFGRRKKQYAKDPSHSHHYFMALKTDQIIDATRKGNVSRFINHSCEPNCETQKWTVGGQLRIGFFTLRDVQPFDELTFDYKFQRYGKEAQKCYCGALSCRGTIDSGEVKTKSYVEKEERKKEKETKNVFEDALFDREFEDTVAVGCLRNQDQVVTFGRLMLRADDYESRRQLLDMILKTEKNILRLFLDLHGCRLLWSWTVDEEACGDRWQDLQLKLLDVLKLLPIPHKNMLQDSRLLSTIERWAGKVRRLDVAANETVEDCVRKTLNDLIDQVCAGTSPLIESEDVTSADDDVDSKESAEAICDKINSEKSKEIVSKSESLLKHWSSLKENFKIPKKIDKKDLIVTDEKNTEATSGSSSVLTKNSKKRSKTKSKTKSSSTSRSRSRSKSKSKDSKDHDRFAVYRYLDYGLDVRSPYGFRRSPSPSSSRHHHHHHYKDQQQNVKRPRSRENSTDRENLKRTKEERRRVFEETVARADEKKLYERQLQDFERDSQAAADELLAQQRHQTPYWTAGMTAMVPSTTIPPTGVPPPNVSLHPHLPQPTFVTAPAPAFPPEGAKPASLVHDQMTSKFWWRDASTGVLVYPATEQQVLLMTTGDHSCIPHFYHDPSNGLIHEVHLRMQTTTAGVVPPGYSTHDDPNEVDMVCEDDGMNRDQRIKMLREQISTLQTQLEQKQTELKWLLEQEESESSPTQSNERPVSNLPADWRAAESNGKVYYYHVVTKEVSWDPPVSHWNFEDQSPVRVSSPSPKRAVTSSLSMASSSAKVKQSTKKYYNAADPRLQHHGRNKDRSEQQRKMKAALKIKNAAFPKKSHKQSSSMKLLSGRKDQQQQHHKLVTPPKASSSLSSSSRKDMDEPVLNVTPFGTTTAAADTSSEVARKLKESFKSAISNHIIKCLNAYRKNECKIGRITNNDDFKHLARKITHAVMEKELKRCHRVEDLHVTDSVFHKAKDYIKRYMVKLGSTYKRSASSP